SSYLFIQNLINLRAQANFRSSFFFFFQAEDGIRDLYVTGVQTCALPISFLDAQLQCPANQGLAARARRGDEEHRKLIDRGRNERSEERRVGKECRSRWATYQ